MGGHDGGWLVAFHALIKSPLYIILVIEVNYSNDRFVVFCCCLYEDLYKKINSFGNCIAASTPFT